MDTTSMSERLLRRLGGGEAITAACAAEGLRPDEFPAWWARETAARVPDPDGPRPAPVAAAVRIDPDARGIPHIVADSADDLFVGFGYAMAADRLFQMDYLRRKATGRLAEILGAEALDLDRLARTVGFPHIAAAEWHTLDA